MVIVTSRQDMSGLVIRDGAYRIELNLMSPNEAVTLLRQVLGADRVDAESRAAATLSRQCAYLPLALRIAADRAAARPRIGLSELVDELANERNRLDVLATTDDPSTAVRAVFSWSYRALSVEAGRMFRLLGLHATPEFSTWAAAALADVDTSEAQRLLNIITNAHLIEEIRHDRYRLHDLLRIYSNECAMADEPEQNRSDAVRRILSWYLHTAESADRSLMPPRRRVSIENLPQGCKPLSFTNDGQALGWCEAERVNLTAATRQAAAQGEYSIAWQIPVALISFFNLRKPWADWIATHDIALAAARHIHNREGEGWVLASASFAYRDLREYEKAAQCLRLALTITREIEDRWAEGTALFNLGDVYRRQQREHDAIDCLEQAQTAFEGVDDSWGKGMTLLILSGVYRELQRSDDAISCLRQALTFFQKIDDGYSTCLALNNLGDLCGQLRQSEGARRYFQHALKVARQIGDRYDEAWALNGLGQALCDMNDKDAARESWRQALAILEELGGPHAAEVRARLQSIEASRTRFLRHWAAYILTHNRQVPSLTSASPIVWAARRRSPRHADRPVLQASADGRRGSRSRT